MKDKQISINEFLKYAVQQCQDKTINEDFRMLHNDIINTIIQFCVKHNIIIDEFHLNADCLEESIKAGSWQPCTDSCLEFDKYSEEYKHIMSKEKKVYDKEFKRIVASEKPFLISL